MDPNARLWSMYLDEADHFDLDMVVSIRDSVDVILVFVSSSPPFQSAPFGLLTSSKAGLFSAIVSTLVSQASTTLKPDYGQIISSLLMELIEVQRATGAGTIKDIARSPLGSESHFTPSSSDRWVNGTWFASLALSLVTALLSTLVKQWIHAYMSPTFNGSSQAQGRARHFRYMGFEKWHVPLIAGLLPTLLHLSLFIFFAGLVVLLFNLDHLIGAVVASIAILAYAAYTVTNLLPLWYSQCPYKTPLSDYAFKVLRIWIPYQYGKIQQLWNLFTIRTPFRGDAVHNISLSDDREKLAQPEQLQSLRHTESRAVHFQADELDAQMIGWLCETSVNPSVKAVVITSLRDLPFGFSAVETLRDCVLPYICAGLRECTKKGLLPLSITSSDTRRVIPGFEAKADVYYQAHLQLTVPGYSRRTHSRLKVLCGCDWVAGESEVAHHHLNVQSIPGTTYRTIEDLSLPALVHYPTCHVSELALLLPTKTSNRMWITLLHRAVVMVLPWRATSYFSLEDDWEHFVSLWRSMPKNDTIERIRDQAEICTFLQRTLLSAYLCHTIRPAGSTPVQDPELLYVAMNEESTLRRASSDEYLSLRSYYSHHTLVQIIYHLTQAAATHAATPLLYVIDRLVQLEGYDLRSPRENTTKFAYSTVLPIDHSLLPLLRHLFPTPPAIRNIIAHHDGDIDRVRLFWDMTFALWHLLLRNVQDERLYDVVTNHDFLGGLDVLHEYLLCGRRHQLEDDLRVKTEVTFQNLVEDYVNGVSSLSNKKYHLASIISYFDRMCCWAYKKDSSRLFPETVYIGLDAWFGTVVAITAEELSTRLAVDDGEDVDEIVDRVAQTLYRENPGDRCSVDTFLEKLVSHSHSSALELKHSLLPPSVPS